jgi:hypothetical protein
MLAIHNPSWLEIYDVSNKSASTIDLLRVRLIIGRVERSRVYLPLLYSYRRHSYLTNFFRSKSLLAMLSRPDLSTPHRHRWGKVDTTGTGNWLIGTVQCTVQYEYLYTVL